MKKVTGIFIMIISLLLVSCENEEWNQSGKNNHNGFTLEYAISNPVSAITRSTIDIEEGEDKINSLYLLFFENSDNGNGLFLEAIDAKELSGMSLGTAEKLQINFPENSVLNNSTEYKILFCANIEEYTTLSIDNIEDIQNHFQGHSENEVIASLSLNISGVAPGQTEQEDDSNLVKPSNLPMNATAIKAIKNANVSIELVRTLSRFDVFCQAAGYELASASIWNANTVGSLWGESSYNSEHTERYYGVKANQDKQIVGSLYAFENQITEPTQNDNTTTCIIIGLKGEERGEIEYFRVNVHANFMEQDLKRNNVYRSTIREVLGQGALTEREAYEGTDLLLDIDINGWMLEDNGNFYHDGTNILALPTKLIELFPYGDERIYNTYTLGEGSPAISYQELPDNITVKLTGNQLTVKAEPSNELREGIIKITFGKLTGSILIRQTPLERDFVNLSISELPAFAHAGGETSEAIQVTSSGTWVAELYDGDYFAFSSQSGPITTVKGESGESFKLETIKANTGYTSRYCFAIVKLQDVPEVSRVILLEQEGYDPRHIYFDYDEIKVATKGGNTGYFKINSNSQWVAELIVETGTKAGFNSSYTTLTKTGNNTVSNLIVYLPAYYGGNKPSKIIVRATIVDSDISADLIVYQDPYYTRELFIGNESGFSNLVETNSINYYYAVYELGQNMRNTSLFGANGSLVNMPNGGFDFKISTEVDLMREARIIQFTTHSSASKYTVAFNNAYDMHQEDPSKLMIFSSHAYTIPSAYLRMFNEKKNLGYGSVESVRNPVVNYMDFHPAANMEHPLIKYLLDGPAGKVDPGKLKFQGATTDAGGLKKGAWPSTFIPIIRSDNLHTDATGKDYCVFGIDPVNRLILIMDPGIFGADPARIAANNSLYYNRYNYLEDKTDNIIFVKNFVAWMARVAVEGESFLKDFQ